MKSCATCGGCTCTEPLHHSPYGHCLIGCKSEPDHLSFAEAMALDPSEPIVVSTNPGCWSRPMELRGGILYFADVKDRMDLVPFKAEYLKATWRRARPRKSRVQEMATSNLGPDIIGSRRLRWAAGAEWAIRAVCEYLRTETPYSKQVPADIERHFLEPR